MYPSFRLQRILVLETCCWFSHSIMFESYCGSLSEPSNGTNSSNYSVKVFCNFYMTKVCVVMYRQNQELTDIRLFSEAQDTWWVSEQRFLEKQLAMCVPELTAGVSRLWRVEILVAFVEGFSFKQIASYRMVRRYSFENKPSWLAFVKCRECENILHTFQPIRNYLYNLYNTELHSCFATNRWQLFSMPAPSFISTYSPGQINLTLCEGKKFDRIGRG